MFWFAGADEGEELGVKAHELPRPLPPVRLEKRSYRELPLRFAEFSRLHRNERTGTLTRPRARALLRAGRRAHLLRARAAGGEIHRFLEMLAEMYGALGLSGVELRESRRRARRRAIIGEPADWERGRALCSQARSRARATRAASSPAMRAFYGPKIECDVRDTLGRAWTLAHDAARHGDARAASGSATSAATARSTSPRCCTARCSARSSASSRSTSSTPAATSRSGSRRCR